MSDHVDVPDAATPEEAAAIAAAIDAYLGVEAAVEAADETTGSDGSWDGDRWRFGARLEALGDRSVRVPRGAPRDPWGAAGRTDRYP